MTKEKTRSDEMLANVYYALANLEYDPSPRQRMLARVAAKAALSYAAQMLREENETCSTIDMASMIDDLGKGLL